MALALAETDEAAYLVVLLAAPGEELGAHWSRWSNPALTAPLSWTSRWSGAKTFFASEGLIMLRTSGTGKMLVSSYGAIHEMTLAAGERHTVDTGHLVAFTEGIGFRVRQVGGLKSTLFSGEGLVVDLTGPGRVLLQSRSTDQFLAWLIPQLPRDDDSGD